MLNYDNPSLEPIGRESVSGEMIEHARESVGLKHWQEVVGTPGGVGQAEVAP